MEYMTARKRTVLVQVLCQPVAMTGISGHMLHLFVILEPEGLFACQELSIIKLWL
jgi:hypothetical protein